MHNVRITLREWLPDVGEKQTDQFDISARRTYRGPWCNWLVRPIGQSSEHNQ